MSQIYHIPLAVTMRHGTWGKQPANDSAELLKVADAFAFAKFGVPAMLMPVYQREVLLQQMHQALLAIDAASPELAS
jgi:hypothetical protein